MMNILVNVYPIIETNTEGPEDTNKYTLYITIGDGPNCTPFDRESHPFPIYYYESSYTSYYLDIVVSYSYENIY